MNPCLSIPASGTTRNTQKASIDAAFRRARDKAGLSGFTFHDSRANALTRLAQVLAPLDLARMIGHRDLGSLLIYYRPSAASIAERLG